MFLMSAFPMMALAAGAPEEVEAEVDGTTLTITFDEPLLESANGIAPNSAFAIGGHTTTIDTVAVSGDTVTLTLGTAVPNGTASVTVSYTAPAADPRLQCAGTNDPVASFGPLAVDVPPVVVIPSDDEEDHTGGGGILLPTVNYEQYREATLPTSAGFTFVLDPQGLYNLDDGDILDLVVEPGGTRLGRMIPTDKISKECDEDLCPDHGVCDEPDCLVHVECTLGDDCDTCATGAEPCDKGTVVCPLVEDCTEVRELEWGLLEDAGQIIFSNYAPYFINDSNYDVALEIEFAFDAAATDVVATATPEAAATGNATNVFIGARFSTANVRTTPGAFAGTLAMAVLDTVRTPLFLLGAAEYDDEITIGRVGGLSTGAIESIVIKQRCETKKAGGDTGHGMQFTLFGYCNPDADWSDVDAGDLAINIKLTLTAPPTTPNHVWEFPAGTYPGVAIPGAYGLHATTALTADDFITWPPVEDDDDPIVPLTSGFLGSGAFPITTGTPSRTWERGLVRDNTGAVTVPFEFDTGVTVLQVRNAANIANVFPATEYTVDTTAGTITFSNDRMAIMRMNPVGTVITWDILITGDSEPYKLEWTLE
jgi:hypothetical protein